MKYLEDEKLLKLTAELADVVLGRSRSIHGRIEAYTMKRAGSDKKYAHALGERYVAEMETVESQLADYKSFIQRHSRFDQEASSGGRKRSQSTGSQLEATKPSQRPRSNSYDDTTPKSNAAALSSFLPLKSPLGNFGEMGTRRLMTDLILTLNASFPDYDFGNIKPSDFEKTGVTNAMRSINERLAEVAVSHAPSFLPDMWDAMDEAVSLSECDVFSYAPKTRDQDDEPLSFLTQTLIADSSDQSSTDVVAPFNNASATVLWTFNYFFVNKAKKRIVFFTCVECMRNEGTGIISDDEVSFVKYNGTEASDADFDLDPAAGVAGGIPISIM